MSAPRSNFMAQSLILSIDVCRRLAISLLLINYLAEFFSGRSWPNICPGIICYFFEILELIVENLCS